MITPEQLLATQKSNVETLFGLTTKAFEGIEKLVELNLQVAKAAMGEAAETTKAALSVKDAQELIALQTSLLQPVAEKAAAYSRHVYDIAATTNAEVSKVVEATAADSQKNFMAAVDNAVKNAPAGSENAVALVKSAVAAANNAYETRPEGQQAGRRSRRIELPDDGRLGRQGQPGALQGDQAPGLTGPLRGIAAVKKRSRGEPTGRVLHLTWTAASSAVTFAWSPRYPANLRFDGTFSPVLRTGLFFVHRHLIYR